jgi:hypothetical protein
MPANAQKQADWAKLTPAQKKAANQAQGGGKNKPGATPAKPAPGSPTAQMNEVFDTSKDHLNNNPNYDAGSQFVQDSLGATNFHGQNDYLAGLGDKVNASNFNEPLDLLRDFLGVGGGGGYGSNSGGNNRIAGGTVRANYAVDGNGQVSFPGQGGSGNVPDTVGNSNSFFAQKIKDLFDAQRLDPANDPTMQPYLDSLKRNALEAHQASQADLSARAEGSGRYGGGLYQNMQAQQGMKYNQALQDQLASTIFGARKDALDRQMGGLGMTNQRDIAAMQDATQRYSADSAASAASSGAGAMSEGMKRGQDLQAMQMLMGHQQFGLGMQGDVGKMMQAQQMGALSAIPGLEGAQQGWMQGMLGGAQGNMQNQISQQNNAAQIKASQIGARPGMLNAQLQQQMYNDPMQQMNQYLQNLQMIGNMGGAQWGQGGPQPGSIPNGADPNIAALMGLIGGGMQGYGAGGGQ